MSKRNTMWTTYLIPTILQLITWYQIWKPFNVSPDVHEGKGIPGMNVFGGLIMLLIIIIVTILSPIVWFYFYILLRYFIFKDPNVKTWHVVFLILGLFPLVFVGFFVFG